MSQALRHPLAEIRVLADRLRRQLTQEDSAAGAVTLSVGIAVFPEHGETGEALIDAADAALYEAKRTGKDRACVARAPAPVRAAG